MKKKNLKHYRPGVVVFWNNAVSKMMLLQLTTNTFVSFSKNFSIEIIKGTLQELENDITVGP